MLSAKEKCKDSEIDDNLLTVTYNVCVERDCICHPVHVVSTANGDTVANLDRALEVDVIAGLSHVHSGHFLVVGNPAISLLATFESLSLDYLLLLVVRLVKACSFL